LLLARSGCAWAQSGTAQITGYVTDPSGSTVPAAVVTVRNETTGFERKVATNAGGYFVVTSLPPGFYTVTVEATGFKRHVKTSNKLDPNIASTVNVSLEVGRVTETIEVMASVTQVQSETATVGKLVESSQIKNMMLNGRNPLFLALLKPGVRGGSLQDFSYGLSSGGFSINGSRTQDNVITFDGASASSGSPIWTAISFASSTTFPGNGSGIKSSAGGYWFAPGCLLHLRHGSSDCASILHHQYSCHARLLQR